MSKNIKIAFDVDGTLITLGNHGLHPIPNYPVIELYRFFQFQGCKMIVWSGGGVDYAYNWAKKLGLEPCGFRIKQKYSDIDLAFDDQEVTLAKVNIKID